MSGIDTHLLLCRIQWDHFSLGNSSDSSWMTELIKSLSKFESEMKTRFDTQIRLVRAACKLDQAQGHLFYAYWACGIDRSDLALASSIESASLHLTKDDLFDFQELLKIELYEFTSRVDSTMKVDLSRLTEVMSLQGASAQSAAEFHYVVETDVEQGWLQEVSRWYDVEHMPGLSRVPGCINAKRYINSDEGPYSLACYDLVAPEVLGCKEWLEVRGTAWSDLARPHFINTRRNMFKVV